MTDDDKDDRPVGTSPRVRDQASLTTSSGRSWLILGGLLTLIAVGTLTFLLPYPPSGLALAGICVVIALYAGMIVTRVNATPGRPMLALLAALMILIALVGLVCVGVIAADQAGVVY